MDHAVVASGRDRNTGVHEFVGIRFTFVAQRVVLRGDDERRRQALKFLVAGTERRDIRIVAGLLVRRIKIPAIFHERACQEAASSKFMVGVCIDTCIGGRNEEHLVRDQGVGGSNPLSPTIFFQELRTIL